MGIYSQVIMDTINESEFGNGFVFVGECAFLVRQNGNNIKVMCGNDKLICKVINRTGGEVDRTELPFSSYFTPKRCSPNAPLWHQGIEGNNWRYAKTDPHCLPTRDDFEALADAVDDYIHLFS